jgi:Lar family restriction alleviation protein
MDELIPCPFCGSTDAEVYPDYPVYVKCGVCETCGPCVRDSGKEWALAKAVELWNRRAPSLFGRPVIETDDLVTCPIIVGGHWLQPGETIASVLEALGDG